MDPWLISLLDLLLLSFSLFSFLTFSLFAVDGPLLPFADSFVDLVGTFAFGLGEEFESRLVAAFFSSSVGGVVVQFGNLLESWGAFFQVVL